MQGGKFEHGFLSGFVSSLGGSYMQANAPNMSKGAQVALAAVIGGTAEALGGGKFANGAVTGAYVMMLNHLGDHGGMKKSYLINESFSKNLANELRYNPNLIGSSNPFFGADAIFIDAGASFVGAEFDAGYYFVLAGEDAGMLIPYSEDGGGGAIELGGAAEIGRVDLADKSNTFKSEMLFGERSKGWVGAGIIGGAVSRSSFDNIKLISTSISIGPSISPYGFSLGGNNGIIKPR